MNNDVLDNLKCDIEKNFTHEMVDMRLKVASRIEQRTRRQELQRVILSRSR